MGTGCVKKLYLHLGRENTVTMDWRVPLSSMGGKTGLELAQEAYAFHITRSTKHRSQSPTKGERATPNSVWSIPRSGEDCIGGDFLNTSHRTIRSASDAETESTPTPAPTSTPAPVYDKVKADVAWPMATTCAGCIRLSALRRARL